MMQVETVDAGNVVVRHPRGTVTIRPGDEKPVQRGDEDRALNRELECTVLEQVVEHGGDAEPFPDPAGFAEAAATEIAKLTSLLIEIDDNFSTHALIDNG